MGTTQSSLFHDDFQGGRFSASSHERDTHLGPFRLIKLASASQKLFLAKTIRPEAFDHFSLQFDKMLVALEKPLTGLCHYKSWSNMENEHEYVLLFDFDEPISSPVIEADFWSLVCQIVESLKAMESSGIFYPALRKPYLRRKSETGSIRLLNPFCFTSFHEKSIRVIFDADTSETEKARFCRLNINRNIKELGILALSLLKNVDESIFLREPSIIRSAIKEVQGKFSPTVTHFLLFCLENRKEVTANQLSTFLDSGCNIENLKTNFDDLHFRNLESFYGLVTHRFQNEQKLLKRSQSDTKLTPKKEILVQEDPANYRSEIRYVKDFERKESLTEAKGPRPQNKTTNTNGTKNILFQERNMADFSMQVLMNRTLSQPNKNDKDNHFKLSSQLSVESQIHIFEDDDVLNCEMVEEIKESCIFEENETAISIDDGESVKGSVFCELQRAFSANPQSMSKKNTQNFEEESGKSNLNRENHLFFLANLTILKSVEKDRGSLRRSTNGRSQEENTSGLLIVTSNGEDALRSPLFRKESENGEEISLSIFSADGPYEPKLLMLSSIDKKPADPFTGMRKIVDFSHELRPSIYHVIEIAEEENEDDEEEYAYQDEYAAEEEYLTEEAYGGYEKQSCGFIKVDNSPGEFHDEENRVEFQIRSLETHPFSLNRSDCENDFEEA